MRTLAILLTAAFIAQAATDPAWTRPYPAHRITGNLYYVGTEDLACYLLTTPEGHILINTGLADSAPLIRESIRSLGFRLEDVKILLTMQGHFDHVAAMEEIRKATGAKVYATEADAPIMEDGGKSDPVFGPAFHFAPVKVDRRLRHGDTINLGGTTLKVVGTPGHSKGSVSYTTTIEGRQVAIVNMASIVMPLKGNAKYPNIVADLETTFARQKELSPDIWVAGHASQFRMKDKHKTGSFVDPDGYRKAVLQYEKAFREQLQK